MTDDTTDSGTILGTTPEDRAKYLRLAEIYGGNVAAQIGANIIPERFTLGADAAPGIGGYIPFRGAAENLAGFVGHQAAVANEILNRGYAAVGSDYRIPNAPNALERAGDRPEKATDVLYTGMGAPQVDPNSSADIIAQGAGRGTGMMFPLLPGGILKPLGAAGKALQWVIPTTQGAKANVAISTGLGTAGSAYAASQLPDQPADASAPTQDKSSYVSPDSILNPVSTAQAATPAKAQYMSPDDVLNPSTRVAAPASGYLSPDQVLNGQGFQPVTSTFSGEGESRFTTGNIVEDLVGTGVALIAGRYFHGLGRKVTQAGRDARMNDPAFAQAAADYNNAQATRQAGGQISEGVDTPQTQAQLQPAGPVARGISRGVDAVLNESKYMQDYAKLTSDGPALYEQLRSQFGMIHKNMLNEDRIAAFMETGVDFDTKVALPAPKRLYEDIARQDVDRKKALQDVLAGENEQDNRRKNTNAGQTGADTRHDFYNSDDTQLQAIINRGRADPVVNELANRFQEIGRQMIRIGQVRNFFNPQEANDILATHQHHVPDADVNGQVTQTFGPRISTPYTGVEQVNTTPWAAQAQHLEKLYHQYDLNDNRLIGSNHQEAVQTQYPNSPQFLTRKQVTRTTPGQIGPVVYDEPIGGPRENVYQVRDGTQTIIYKADNPDFYSWMSGNNVTRQRLMLDQIGVMRRMFSGFTTGIGSLLTGRMQPLTNVLRTSFGAPINRPWGTVGGLADALVQRATRVLPERMQFGYRGPDPTNLVGAAYSAGRTSFDRLAFHLSQALDSTNSTGWGNPVNKLLRSMLTPGQVDAMSTSLKNYYMNTVTAEQRVMRGGGVGSPFRSELPAYTTGQGRKVRMISNAQVPELFMANQMAGLRPHVVNIRKAIESTFNTLSDAGHDYFYRSNRVFSGKSARSIGYETRELVGDPSTRGSSPRIQALTDVLPYANVSMQGLARRGRAFAETPIGTSAAYASAIGSVALLSLMTAMRSPEHMKHLEEGLTTQQRESNPTFYLDPDPYKATQFSLAQEDRILYPIMLDLISKGINLHAAQYDPDHAMDVYKFIKDFFAEHVENSTLESTLHALNDQTNFLNVPPIVNAIMGPVTGSTGDIDVAKLYDAWSNGTLSWDTVKRAGGGPSNTPNVAPGDSVLDGENGKRWGLIISNLFGAFGSTLDRMVTSMHQGYKQDQSTWETMGNVAHDWVQGMQDQAPALNFLWEHQIRASTYAPIVEAVGQQLAAMKETAGARSAQRAEGFTSAGRSQLPMPDTGGEAKVPTDPLKRDLYVATATLYGMIENRFMPDIKDLRKQMDAVNMVNMNPTEQREWSNTRAREIADKYRLIHTYVQDLEAYMSQKVGHPVTVMQRPWQ